MSTRLRAAVLAAVTAAGAAVAVIPAATIGPAGPAVAAEVPTPAQRILPTPTSLATRGGPALTFTKDSVIDVGTSARPSTETVANVLASFLRAPTGYAWPVAHGSTAASRVVMQIGGPASLGTEGYRLDVNATTATISARTDTGLFHGVQTLRQLMPPSVEKRSVVSGTTWSVPQVLVTDSPRYPIRGAMLDVARHFMTVNEVKRYIDAMVPLKLNTFELHLADDQGWRLFINSWPRLATYGGSLEVGGTPGGYYTQQQYSDIVAYAAARHITLVPEIDVPSHTNAALASYAELNCDGKAPPLYTGIEVGFSTLCAGLPVTYRFLDDVIAEIAALTPGRYISIGGDEAHSTTQADYTTIIDRTQTILHRYGKQMWGWHQIAGADPAKGSVAAYWGTTGSAADIALAQQAAAKGQRLVMAPADHAYLDMKYSTATPYGQSWAAYVPVPDSYAWDPATLVAGIPPSSIAGVLAPLWTETLPDIAKAQYMAFPRLAGIAQLGWSPERSHDEDAYLTQLAAQGRRWQAAGVHFFYAPEVAWGRFAS